MAKIRLKGKLPKGFKLVNGKVVEDKLMRTGGDMYTTGDQADYGLVSVPQEYYGETSFNNTRDENVRYSLSSVPRENANVEAERGETVLTDLSGDGTFGLYNIGGKRHSQGGTPMFLPEQSFIFSDTTKMKFNRDEMAEFGIESKKKKTPAAISKKFDINDFYAELDSQYADDISSRSAELMLKKNMMDLSKLGFMQENKKNFEEGVPLIAHPFLLSVGVDPLEFTAKIENISQQQAQQNTIDAMPPGEQEKLMMLQAMLQQAEAMPVQPQQPNPADQMQLAQADMNMMQTAAYGGPKGEDAYLARRDAAIKASMKKAQEGGEPDNEGFRALPDFVQDKIMKRQQGGGGVPGEQIPGMPTKAQLDAITGANKISFVPNTPQYKYLSSLPNQSVDFQLPNFDQSSTFNEPVVTRLYKALELSKLPEQSENFELPNFRKKKMQDGGENTETSDNTRSMYEINGRPVERAEYIDYVIRQDLHRGIDGKIPKKFLDDLSNEEKQMYGKALTDIADYDIFNKPTYPEDLSVSESEIIQSDNSEGSASVVSTVEETVDENIDEYKNPFPKGSENYDKMEKYRREGYTFSLTSDGRLRAYRPYQGRFDKSHERVREEIEGEGTGSTVIYSDDIETQGQILEGSPIGQYRYGRYSKGSRPLLQNPAGDGSYGSSAFMSDEGEADFMERWGDVVSQIEGFDYDAGRDNKQWGEFQKLAEKTRQDEARKLATDSQGVFNEELYNKLYVPYFKEKGSDGYIKGEGFDSKFGFHTFNAPRLDIDFGSDDEQFFDIPDDPIEPNPLEEADPPIDRFWQQDLNNLRALGMMEDNLYLPYAPQLERPVIDYVLDDPTQAINANLGAQNTMAEALSTYGPQQIARSNIQGKTMGANAKAINLVNQNNVRTMNQVGMMQPQLDYKFDLAQSDIDQNAYDGTVKALQDSDNFDNAYINKAVELMNTAQTNKANTANLNSLYDYFGTNPDEYGKITFSDQGKQFYKQNKEDADEAYFRKIAEYTRRTGVQPTKEIENRLYQTTHSGLPNVGGNTYGQQELQSRGIPGYPGSNVQVDEGKHGMEKKIKKWVMPFYSGKMGM
tara:strand:+ start:3866 stop:7108 length:3243 start_codon:yes stop_codon:yes gene_type:complete